MHSTCCVGINSWAWAMKSSVFSAIAFLSAGPALYVALAYAEGRFQTGPLFCLLPMLAGGFVSAGAWFYFMKLSGIKASYRVIIPGLLAIFAAHYVIVFLFLPNPLQIWSEGFLDGIDSRIGLRRLQKWG